MRECERYRESGERERAKWREKEERDRKRDRETESERESTGAESSASMRGRRLPIICRAYTLQISGFRLPPWRQPKGKWMVSFVNSHTNTTSKGWHLWEIDFKICLQLDSRVEHIRPSLRYDLQISSRQMILGSSPNVRSSLQIIFQTQFFHRGV